MLTSNKTGKTAVLGILGGGQLAKMLSLAAYRMGLNVAIIDKEKSTPAGDMTQYEFSHGWENRDDLDKFIQICDFATLENEFIDPEIIRYVESQIPVYPSSASIAAIEDKFVQKTTFENAGLPVPKFAAVDNVESAIAFGKKFGFPFLLKTRLLGYDGYGNFTVNNEGEVSVAFDKFAGKPLMAEEFIPFKKELAVMVTRGAEGEEAVYPCVETIQQNHICHTVIAPAPIEEAIRHQAQYVATRCVKSINGIGIFGVELFLTRNNRILINEIAPRPHNSGHYTIEACITSQYENCIRSILKLPLGSTEMVRPAAVMINLLGGRSEGPGTPADITGILKYPMAKLHLYNKKSCRKGRKMGHITVLGDNTEETLAYARDAANSIIW